MKTFLAHTSTGRNIRFDATSWTDAEMFCEEFGFILDGLLKATLEDPTPLERELAECLEAARQ